MYFRYDIIKYRCILIAVNFIRFFKKKRNIDSSNSFFILGSGRNGSTLVASILNADKNIFIPPEQFVLPYAIMKKYLLPYTTNVWQKDVLGMFKEERKTLNWNAKLKDVIITDKNIYNFFNQIYISYAKSIQKNIKLWGDKTPINIHFIKYIYPEFKNSKYIYLLRDPRDVVLSYKKLKNHKAVATKYAIWKWKDSVRQLRYLQKQTNVLLVKYEELVSDPTNEVNKILNYLNLEDNNQLIQSKSTASQMGVGAKEHHKNLNKEISTDSIGKWKEKLAKEDITQVENECADYLKEFGYL